MYPLAGESGHVNGDWLSVSICGNPGGLYATSGFELRKRCYGVLWQKQIYMEVKETPKQKGHVCEVRSKFVFR